MKADVRATEAEACRSRSCSGGHRGDGPEFTHLPFGGHAGGLSGGHAAPPPPRVIEPPPWAAEETGPLVPLAARATGEERPDTLAVMRAEDGETSWPEPPGSQCVGAADPAVPPPANWRAEEAEGAHQRAAEVQERLDRPETRTRPALRREKPALCPA